MLTTPMTSVRGPSSSVLVRSFQLEFVRVVEICKGRLGDSYRQCSILLRFYERPMGRVPTPAPILSC